jgi:hypothetical protein
MGLGTTESFYQKEISGRAEGEEAEVVILLGG